MKPYRSPSKAAVRAAIDPTMGGTFGLPAVDTEAAAVWERLTIAEREEWCLAVEGETRTGDVVYAQEHGPVFDLFDLIIGGPGVQPNGPRLLRAPVTDLGRRVAAHGKAVAK